MKEKKFRAWYRDQKRMFDVYGISWQTGASAKINRVVQKDGLMIDAEDVDLLEYTGLKDKNGTEIYEGDILADDRRVKTEVRWEIMEYDGVVSSHGWCIGEPEKYYEVIGNIYENPELLNK